MKTKKKRKVSTKSKSMSSAKMMFLSIILLFIVFEALFVLKGQQSLQANSSHMQVAGVATHK